MTRPQKFDASEFIVDGVAQPADGTVLTYSAGTASFVAAAAGGALGNATGNKSGTWFTPSMVVGTGAQVGTTTLNKAQVIPILLRAGTLDRIGCNQATNPTAGEFFRLGIYSDDGNGYPGALLVDGGQVLRATSGFKTVTINQAITTGIYWIAVAYQGGSTIGNVIVVGSNSDGNRPISVNTMADSTNLFATSPAGYKDTGISAAFPATWTSTAQGMGSGFDIPILGVRYA
jgi:hypothetical protein